MLYIGEQKHISIVGAVGSNTTVVRPAKGFEWLVQRLAGYHDDNAAARVCRWAWYDKYGTTYNLPETATTAINVPVSINTNGSDNSAYQCGMPLRLTYDFYVAFQVISIGAAKKMTIIGTVLERLENIETFLFKEFAEKAGFKLPVNYRERW